MIALEGISKTYPKTTTPAVQELDLHVPEGTISMFIGPSVGWSRIESSPSRVSFMSPVHSCKRYAGSATKCYSMPHSATETHVYWIISADGQEKHPFLV